MSSPSPQTQPRQIHRWLCSLKTLHRVTLRLLVLSNTTLYNTSLDCCYTLVQWILWQLLLKIFRHHVWPTFVWKPEFGFLGKMKDFSSFINDCNFIEIREEASILFGYWKGFSNLIKTAATPLSSIWTQCGIKLNDVAKKCGAHCLHLAAHWTIPILNGLLTAFHLIPV